MYFNRSNSKTKFYFNEGAFLLILHYVFNGITP